MAAKRMIWNTEHRKRWYLSKRYRLIFSNLFSTLSRYAALKIRTYSHIEESTSYKMHITDLMKRKWADERSRHETNQLPQNGYRDLSYFVYLSISANLKIRPWWCRLSKRDIQLPHCVIGRYVGCAQESSIQIPLITSLLGMPVLWGDNYAGSKTQRRGRIDQ